MASPIVPATTAAELHALLDYDKETGELRWKHNRHNGRNGKVAGCRCTDGVIRIAVQGQLLLAHRVIWCMVTGDWPAEQIDHMNGDRFDNRLSNLRAATHAENNRNRKVLTKNKIGFKGVRWHSKDKKFMARIGHEGRQIHLGSFDTSVEAARAYDAAAPLYHGEFARINGV